VEKAVRGKFPLTVDPEFSLVLFYEGAKQAAEEAVSAWMARDRIEVKGTKKGRPYHCDVKPFIENYRIEEGRVEFLIQKRNAHRPRPGDLARALGGLPRFGAVEIQVIQLVRGSFSSPGSVRRGNGFIPSGS
jgi:hypothetical protein